MKFRNVLKVFLVGALVAGFTVAAFAGHSRQSSRMFGRDWGLIGQRTLMKLNLSSSQKVELAKIIVKYRTERMNAMDRLLNAKEMLTAAIYTEDFNETNIQQASRQVSLAREELTMIRAKIIADFKTVLDPDQLNLLKEKNAKRFEKKKERLAFRRSMIEAMQQAQSK
jgi:Spy/CpxP family protein refolding chaperone